MAADLLPRVHEHVTATIERERLDLCADDLLAPVGASAVPQPFVLDEGAVHADLIEDDHADFQRLLELLPRPWKADEIASAAQQWRLPVVPYRNRSPLAPTAPNATDAPRPLPRGLRVVELTTMWAGPLTGHLLATLDDADVVRITHPERHEPSAYRHLDDGKVIIPLDLDRADDIESARSLLADADILISNYSRRVLPNLGFDDATLRELNPRLFHLNIAGFDSAGPCAEWLTFGAGVHAYSGLGDRGDGSFEPAPFSYPDPLAALDGYVQVRRAITMGRVGRIDVSLHDAVTPLLRTS